MGVMTSLLTLWVVYDHPLDMPDHVVARLHEVHSYGSKATNQVIVGDSIEAVRDQLPHGLSRLPRDEADEPHIVEVWL